MLPIFSYEEEWNYLIGMYKYHATTYYLFPVEGLCWIMVQYLYGVCTRVTIALHDFSRHHGELTLKFDVNHRHYGT
jgi:hypothetical protein